MLFTNLLLPCLGCELDVVRCCKEWPKGIIQLFGYSNSHSYFLMPWGENFKTIKMRVQDEIKPTGIKGEIISRGHKIIVLSLKRKKATKPNPGQIRSPQRRGCMKKRKFLCIKIRQADGSYSYLSIHTWRISGHQKSFNHPSSMVEVFTAQIRMDTRD